MTNFVPHWAEPLLSNSPLETLIAAGIFAVSVLALILVRRLVRRQLKRMLATETTELLEIPLEVLSRTNLAFFIVFGLFLGLQPLTIGDKLERLLSTLMTIALFRQFAVWAMATVAAFIDRKRRQAMVSDRAAVGSLGIIAFLANVAIWSIVVLLTLDNFGVDITALIAGLGIGGIAVALALQNVLGDLFASLSITLDQPFVVGDFLIVGEFIGTVEYIGVKSTRLRSISGEQIIISNGDLLGSRIRNNGRMSQRRIVFATNIAYETPVELVEQIPALIREIVEKQPNTQFDRSHFRTHGASSLDFETVYFVLSSDFNEYVDIQQVINLSLHRKFAELGIEFAYPTQKLFLSMLGGKDSEPANGAGDLAVREP